MNFDDKQYSRNNNIEMNHDNSEEEDIVTSPTKALSFSVMVDYEQSVYEHSKMPMSKLEKIKNSTQKAKSAQRTQSLSDEPFNKIQTRTRTKWVSNKDSPNCMRCKKPFGYLNRYHHCRLCAIVVCDKCSGNRIFIPSYITNIPTPDGIPRPIDRTKKVRVCNKCNKKVNHLKRLETLIEVFELCELDIFEIKKIKEVCGMWHKLGNFYLSRFREIQYKLPHQLYDKWEVWALWVNREHFPGHDIWMTHLIRSMLTVLRENTDKNTKIKFSGKLPSRISDEFARSEISRLLKIHNSCRHKTKNHRECWKLMCTRTCQPHFTAQSALGLLDVKHHYKLVRESAINSFGGVCDSELECYLPYLLHKLIHPQTLYNNPEETTVKLDNLLFDFILLKCQDNIRIANSVYWSLCISKESSNPNTRTKCEIILKALNERVSTETIGIIENIGKYVSVVENNYSSSDPVGVIKELHSLSKCVSPTRPEKGTWNIESGAISMKQSITKPIVIPLTQGDDSEIRTLMELWKKEDVRNDKIMICNIRLMDLILKRDLGIDLGIATYDVQPTSKDSGFIEMVQNCKTLYGIEKYHKLSLLNYIIESNPDTSTAILRQRFIKSCAAYCVITKLLGIGDRHLDNIMMKDTGELFHIDYGFILGRDPKPMKLSEMRITPQMMDAIGGVHSESYKQFKDLCSKIYNTLRRYTTTFEYLMTLLVESEPTVCGSWLTHDKLYQEITKRFEPNSTYKEAEIRLYSRIDNSTSFTNGYKYQVIDFFHRHNKESTMSNIVSLGVTTTARCTKNFLVGVWDYITTTGDEASI